jgi:hypothetical protein
MMESFGRRLKEEVLTPFQLTVDVELRTRSTNTVLRLECWLVKSKTTGFRLRQLCQQLPPLPDDQ